MNSFSTLIRLDRVTAGFVGLTPAMIFLGRAPLAVVAGMAIILILCSADRREILSIAKSIIISAVGAAVLIIFLLWLPSLTVSPHPGHSAFTILRSVFYVISGVLIWAFLCGSDEKVDIALRTLTISALVLSTVAVLAILFWPQLFNITHLKPLEPVDPVLAYKQTGSAAVLMVPLVALLTLRDKFRWRLAGFACLAMLLSTIILTGNRAGMLSVVLVGVAVASAVIIHARRFRLGFILLSLSVLLSIAAVVWNAEQRTASPPDGAIMFLPDWTVDWHRQTIWETSLEFSAEHRLAGVGVNAINTLPGAQEYIGNTKTKVLAFHPHNWFIEILAETGVPSVLWMTFVLAVIFVRLWKRVSSTVLLPAVASLAVWVGYWSAGLFNFSYWSSWWMMSFYICMAIPLAAGSSRAASSRAG